MTDKTQTELQSDKYMPTNAEWEAYPWAVAAATNVDGEMRLYGSQEIVAAETADWQHNGKYIPMLKTVTPTSEAYFNTTLRHRPEGI